MFTDSSPTGIGNIAGQTILVPILDALNDIGNSSNTLKLQLIGEEKMPLFLSTEDKDGTDCGGLYCTQASLINQ